MSDISDSAIKLPFLAVLYIIFHLFSVSILIIFQISLEILLQLDNYQCLKKSGQQT